MSQFYELFLGQAVIRLVTMAGKVRYELGPIDEENRMALDRAPISYSLLHHGLESMLT
jgi:hypothetical protein